ncbi:unnamed protein product, partial [Hapterophycus canaliculatus]
MFLLAISRERRWIADSGSTFHITGDPRLTFKFQPIPIEQSRLAIANGIPLNVLGKGSVNLIMHAQTDFLVTLHDVLLVENMRFNLFSLHAGQRKQEIILDSTGIHPFDCSLTFP